ncbi:MAG: RnfABCDGE type electron transport complex subunit D [Geminocystis sp.]|nr:RnfABCDGE type electron transport complex subunit D [Geminocystis sp.]MDW8116267.1 RnfABCDGE type electron transport complex subunit D [Geminocystis sp.]MDW8462742.1 RnfABCDGE type electron transport complex subunit D [Geminocystis sp.]
MKLKLFVDPRDYQICFLILFLLLGIFNRDWHLSCSHFISLILSCLLTQFIAENIANIREIFSFFSLKICHYNQDFNWKITGLKSALTTSLGLSLLIRSNGVFPLVVAGVTAIASKFIFSVGKKHFFNPGNFGIISALALTHNAWVSPGQWGHEWFYLALFICTGALVLNKVGRWETTGAFLITYILLSCMYNCYLGWEWDVVWHQLGTGSLLVFAFFMISDPRSIPDSKIGRTIWSILVATLAFVLGSLFYVYNAIFISLFVLSPLTVLLDKIWEGQRFYWPIPQVQSEHKLSVANGGQA